MQRLDDMSVEFAGDIVNGHKRNLAIQIQYILPTEERLRR
jgi:hypothetical protein